MKKFEKIIKERILPNFKGFKYEKSIMFKTPLRDILSGFYFERIDKHVYVWLFFQPLFIPHKNLYFTFGERLGQKHKRFSLDEADMDNTIEILNNLIRLNIDAVENLEPVQEFYNYFSEKNTNFNTFLDLVFTSCFLGKPDSRLELKTLRDEINTSDNMHLAWMQELLTRTELLMSSTQEEKSLLFAEWRKFTLNEIGLRSDK